MPTIGGNRFRRRPRVSIDRVTGQYAPSQWLKREEKERGCSSGANDCSQDGKSERLAVSRLFDCGQLLAYLAVKRRIDSFPGRGLNRLSHAAGDRFRFFLDYRDRCLCGYLLDMPGERN